MVHGRDKVPLLGRTAAAGTRTDAAVIRVGEVSSGEVQQEMRRWHTGPMGRERLSPFCAHSVDCGRPQTRAVPSADNHTSLDWSGLNRQ